MPNDKLKFLIDIGVGKKLEKWLEDSGYDVKSMRHINPKSEDMEILNMAVSESRMVVTMDKDFGELVYKSGMLHAGVLILRLEDATGAEKVDVIKAILRDHEAKLRGKFCVFQSGRLRVAG